MLPSSKQVRVSELFSAKLPFMSKGNTDVFKHEISENSTQEQLMKTKQLTHTTSQWQKSANLGFSERKDHVKLQFTKISEKEYATKNFIPRQFSLSTLGSKAGTFKVRMN